MAVNPLEAIEFRLRDLFVRRQQIDQEIAALQEARKPLLPVYAETGPGPIPLGPIPSIEDFIHSDDVGITDAVRGAFRLNAGRGLTALQIREVIESHGFDLSKYNNAMANIHQVIKRLIDAGEVDPSHSGEKTVYVWIDKKPGVTRETIAQMGRYGGSIESKLIPGAPLDIPPYHQGKKGTK